MTRRLLVFVVLAMSVIVTACGGSVAKTFPRTTLAAAQDPNVATDPKLSEARMFNTHPCQILIKLHLLKFGGYKETERIEIPDDPNYCDTDLQTKNGYGAQNFVELALDTNVDAGESKLGSERIRGLPTRMESGKGIGCIAHVLTDSRAKKGVELRYSGDDANKCGAARGIAEQAIDELRRNKYQRDEPASLGKVRPCGLVDPNTVRAVTGTVTNGSRSEGTPYRCQWRGPDGVVLEVQLRDGHPHRANEKVDLGGVQATKWTGTTDDMALLSGCNLEWWHMKDKHDFDENVRVSVGTDSGKGDRLCEKATQAAKVVLGKLPRR